MICAMPARNDVVAVATVAIRTNDISWSVLAKHSGRSPNVETTRARDTAAPCSTSPPGTASSVVRPSSLELESSGGVSVSVKVPGFSTLESDTSAIFDAGSIVLVFSLWTPEKIVGVALGI